MHDAVMIHHPPYALPFQCICIELGLHCMHAFAARPVSFAFLAKLEALATPPHMTNNQVVVGGLSLSHQAVPVHAVAVTRSSTQCVIVVRHFSKPTKQTNKK